MLQLVALHDWTESAAKCMGSLITLLPNVIVEHLRDTSLRTTAHILITNRVKVIRDLSHTTDWPPVYAVDRITRIFPFLLPNVHASWSLCYVGTNFSGFKRWIPDLSSWTRYFEVAILRAPVPSAKAAKKRHFDCPRQLIRQPLRIFVSRSRFPTA